LLPTFLRTYKNQDYNNKQQNPAPQRQGIYNKKRKVGRRLTDADSNLDDLDSFFTQDLLNKFLNKG